MRTLPPTGEMERAFQRRDASYDGVFFVAVRTTAIFCRPSCPARKPRLAHVRFFGTARDALLSGYRPCKRCRPLDVNGRPPAWVQRLFTILQQAPAQRLRDTDLRALSIDPARARRYFRRNFSMTFQAFCRTMRMGAALDEIRGGAALAAVGCGHGYESDSGFRAAFERVFERPPGRARGVECVAMQMVESPLGPLLACATANAVCFLEFADRDVIDEQFTRVRKLFGCAVVPGTNAHVERLRDELARYFAGALREFTVPLDYRGTPFQQAVWERLLRIPYGQTLSYEQLARDIGRPGAQRAVGMANHSNPIAIVIPCHRVVNKDGKLGGYGGGLWRKQFLLDLESGQSGDRAEPRP